MHHHRRHILRAALGGALATLLAPSAHAQQLRQRRNRAAGDTPSGLPVPRMVSLKKNLTRGRAGPDRAYREVLMYRRQGLPVRVIAETWDWRRIEDAQGNRVWVAAHLLSSRRTAIVVAAEGTNVAMRRAPRADARTQVNLGNGVIVQLDNNQPEAAWRHVRVGRHHGWVATSQLWGA